LLHSEQENPQMAKKKRKRASRDIKVLGGLDAITKLLVKAHKTGRQRLTDAQIRTGLAVSVGGIRKQVVLRRRASDPGRPQPADRDPRDPIHIRCDQD
jgi:hypothetical protein